MTNEEYHRYTQYLRARDREDAKLQHERELLQRERDDRSRHMQEKEEEEEEEEEKEEKEETSVLRVATISPKMFFPKPVLDTPIQRVNRPERAPVSKCKHCSQEFRRFYAYRRHISSGVCADRTSFYWCNFCDATFVRRKDRACHERDHLLEQSRSQSGAGFNRIEDLHGCGVFQRIFLPEEGITTIEAAFRVIREDLLELLRQRLRFHKMLRAGTVVLGRFGVLDEQGEITQQADIPLRATYQLYFLGDANTIPNGVREYELETLKRLDELETTGSGWVLLQIITFTVEAGKCNMVGSCNTAVDLSIVPGGEYLIDVPLKEEKNWCFLSAVTQHFVTKHNPETTRNWIDEHLKINKKHLPMDVNNVRYFEAKNQHLRLGVNVFLRDGKECYPAYRSKLNNPDHLVNLLLLRHGRSWHYVYIEDLDKLLLQYNHIDGMRRRHNSVHCHNCLSNFTCAATLKAHEEICFSNKTQLLTMPDTTKPLKFEQHLKKYGHEFVGFADFEAALVPEQRQNSASCLNCQNLGRKRDCSHATHAQNTQVPICYALVFVDRDRNVVFQRCETAADVMPLFFAALKEAEKLLLPLLQAAKANMIWTEEDDVRYKSARVCHVCEEPFGLDYKLKKVRDHCHRTGKALGACHHQCNIDRRVKRNLLVYIHNFKGYDSHFIIRGYQKKVDEKVKGLASNTQKFRTVDLGRISFVDSLSLLNTGLAELVRDLGKDHSYKILESSGIYKTPTQRRLLVEGKGVFPYEYISGYHVLQETSLPPRERFYSVLREDTVSEEDYEQAVTTFEIFECADLAAYTRLYCLLDTLLLGEVMLEFVDEAMKDFGLDATNYISIPQLSFDAMLKMTKIRLDYLPDLEMVLLFEKGIRGGVSYVNTRMVSIEKDGGHLMYFDFNNLYGWAQMQQLPARQYRWLPSHEISCFDVLSVPDNGLLGYALEVDMEYPQNIRDLHSLMPLAPEHLNIFFPDLSDYSKECLKAIQPAKACERYNSSKLCGTFFPKEKYLVHYRNLKFYLKHGLKVTKVHRIIEFEQEAFAKPYIDFTAEKRKNATSDFKRMTAKLCANGNFGKWLQNARKYMNVVFASKASTAMKYLGNPRFISFRILNDSLIAIFLHKREICMDRKFSVGFTILELSKLKMFECLYDDVLPAFGRENVDIVLSDTDSYVFHIKNYSKDEIRLRLKSLMDFSNMDKQHELFDASKCKVPGFLKDEVPNGDIVECIAPKSKCYVIRTVSKKGVESTEKKCKGLAKPRVKRLNVESYRGCILSKRAVKATMARIQVKNHVIQTVMQNKICMTSFDDKRYLLSCGVHSRPYQREAQSDECKRCK